MIAVYAEKFDVGVKIAASCGGFVHNGTRVTMKNIEKLKEELEKTIKRTGYINVNFEGEDYSITWGQGHMCSLKQAQDYDASYKNWGNMPLPFFPANYEIKVREGVDRDTHKLTGNPDPWTLRQLGIIEDIFNECEYIINATDDDREGETIFAYVYEYLNCSKPYKRMVIDSQTEEGFINSMHNLKSSSSVKGIEMAGRSRGIADWVVGANLSAGMSLKYGNRSVISIGRVQTPVLNMLVEREKAILNFVSKPFWYIEGKFTTADGKTYVGKYAEAQIEDKKKAETILNSLGSEGVITSYEKETFKKEVPLLYSLTTLSMDANEKYGYTSKETGDIAEELYQAGYITYPRTVSQHLTDDMRDSVDEILDVLSDYSSEYKSYIDLVPAKSRNYTKRHFDSSKVESHFAVIPTNVKPEKLTDKQAQLYDLIARSLIKIIFKPAVGERTKITTSVGDEDFKTTGNIIKEEQWLVVEGDSNSEDLLPVLSKGDEVTGEYSLKEGKTQPPRRYNDKTIISAMVTAGKDIEDEELKKILAEAGDGGIGTPATRANIVETLIKRSYAERKGSGKVKNIVPTEMGIKLIDILPVNELKSAKLTADWELRLKKIEKGEDDLESFVKDMEAQTEKWVEEVKEAESATIQKADNETDYNCPQCGSPLRKYSWGWACSGYKKDNPDSCRFSLGYNMAGAKLTDKDFKDLLTKKKTRFINGFKKKDSEETYGAFLILDDDGKIGRSWETGIDCPLCGKPIKVMTKSWSCSGWGDGCKVTVWDVTFGKKLSDSDKIDLLTKRKTKLIKGFVKKDGTTYDAKLILDDTGKVTFAPREDK